MAGEMSSDRTADANPVTWPRLTPAGLIESMAAPALPNLSSSNTGSVMPSRSTSGMDSAFSTGRRSASVSARAHTQMPSYGRFGRGTQEQHRIMTSGQVLSFDSRPRHQSSLHQQRSRSYNDLARSSDLLRIGSDEVERGLGTTQRRVASSTAHDERDDFGRIDGIAAAVATSVGPIVNSARVEAKEDEGESQGIKSS